MHIRNVITGCWCGALLVAAAVSTGAQNTDDDLLQGKVVAIDKEQHTVTIAYFSQDDHVNSRSLTRAFAVRDEHIGSQFGVGDTIKFKYGSKGEMLFLTSVQVVH